MMKSDYRSERCAVSQELILGFFPDITASIFYVLQYHWLIRTLNLLSIPSFVRTSIDVEARGQWAPRPVVKERTFGNCWMCAAEISHIVKMQIKKKKKNVQ